MEDYIEITGAVVQGEYIDYPHGGMFTYEGDLIDKDRNGHPMYQNDGEDIQLEFQGGMLDIPMRADEYILKYTHANPNFIG